MASKAPPPCNFTHWARPRGRMYDYNYQVASSYYKPQVDYIGETVDSKLRAARRRTVSPPGARTYTERWAANPFYGKCYPISEYEFSKNLDRGRSRLVRASSVPAVDVFAEEAVGGAGFSVARAARASRARSMTRESSVMREQSVYREQSVATTRRARSVTRARSVSRAGSVYEGDYDDSRTVRGQSYFDDAGYYYDPLSDEEWDKILRVANKDEREKSIFSLRMALENPKTLPQKKMMTTTVGHGIYKSNLYGVFTWDPEPYVANQRPARPLGGRQ